MRHRKIGKENNNRPSYLEKTCYLFSMFDVIIIGAGLCGLSAARVCRTAGLSTLIVEASDRVGGRVWTSAAPATQCPVDWGAEWVIPSMHHEVMKLVAENRLGLLDDDAASPTMWKTTHTRFQGSYPDLQRHSTAFAESLQRIEQDAILWSNAKPTTTHPETTMRNYLRHVTPDIETAELIETALFPLTGADPEDLATRMLWAEIGFHNHSIDETLNASTKRISEGCGALASAIASELEGCIEYEQVVTHISRSNDRYVIQTEKTVYHAKHCVVAVPLKTLQNIAFEPHLSPELQETAKNSNAGRVAKAWALVRSEQPLGETLNSRSQLRYGYTRRLDGHYRLVCGQILGAETIPVTNSHAVALIKENWPDVEIIEAKVIDWTHEPFAKASWHSGRAGWASKTAAFRQPHKNLHFAGGDIAEQWAGWMEGALRSGKEVGQRIIAAAGH
jgi:monoamine oxidase